MKIDLSSAGVGALSLLTIFLLLGATTAPDTSRARGELEPPVHVAGIPSPEALVRIDAREDFGVPTGSALVITGVACSGVTDAFAPFDGGTYYQITVDGEAVLAGNVDIGDDSTETYTPGFRIDGPAIVRLENLNDRLAGGPQSSTDPVLSGYLAELP